MNKKAEFSGLFFFFVMIMVVLVLGFIGSIVIGIVSYSSGILAPTISGMGMVGDDINMTQIASMSSDKGNAVIQNMQHILAVLYIFGLILIFGMAITINLTGSKFLMGLYFMLAVFVIGFCILMSNAYENLVGGTDIIATQLQQQGAMTFLMIHSPSIFTVLIFLGGFFALTGLNREDFS